LFTKDATYGYGLNNDIYSVSQGSKGKYKLNRVELPKDNNCEIYYTDVVICRQAIKYQPTYEPNKYSLIIYDNVENKNQIANLICYTEPQSPITYDPCGRFVTIIAGYPVLANTNQLKTYDNGSTYHQIITNFNSMAFSYPGMVNNNQSLSYFAIKQGGKYTVYILSYE